MTTEANRLPERATVATAEELVAAALAFNGEGSFDIDASLVEAIDGPVVLAIANITQTLTAKGVSITVQSPTSAFVDAFTDLGVFDDFMKMELRQ